MRRPNLSREVTRAAYYVWLAQRVRVGGSRRTSGSPTPEINSDARAATAPAGRHPRGMMRSLRLTTVFAALALAAGARETPRLAPELSGDIWLNSPPLTLAELRGKVVLVEFWTFACWNCKNVEPHVRAWHERYAEQGLTVIGVHSPEFERERDLANVKQYVAEHHMAWPVLVDNGFRTWKRFANRYWPAFYLIDKQGHIRHQRFGEGGYSEMETWIQRLIAEGK